MTTIFQKTDRAIKFLQSIPQDGPIELAYSTGKDSDVILELARMSGIPFEPIYRNTTCDRPGSIRHAREMGVEIRQPKMNFLKLIEMYGWPSRYTRFCCAILKEYKIHDRAIFGIRRAESVKRAQRYTEPEICRVYSAKEKTRQYFPILDWTNEDVAEFVKERKLKLHPHYYDEQGNLDVKRRVGCIGCPMQAASGVKDFKQFPTIFRARVKAYVRWWNSHPLSKTVQEFPSPYHAIYMKLFCKNMQDYNIQLGEALFDNQVDIKQFLEDYFNTAL